MTKPHLHLVTPATVNRTVTLRRPKNVEMRSREYLTPDEVGRLLDAAKGNRYGHRDSLMVLMAYRHGLRAAELCDLKWDQVHLDSGLLAVRRRKKGLPSTHPLQGDEMRALRRLKRDGGAQPYVFVTERNAPFTTSGFAMLMARAGARAGFPFKVHPHMLRHACGYKLANDGHDTRSLQLYLGHKNIQHTCKYTELAPNRFKGWWD